MPDTREDTEKAEARLVEEVEEREARGTWEKVEATMEDKRVEMTAATLERGVVVDVAVEATMVVHLAVATEVRVVGTETTT